MKATVIQRKETAKKSGIFLLEFLLNKPIKIEPGQFITLKPLNPFSVMPRPFSVCSISETNNQISIMFKAVGGNTKAYSKLRPDDQIEISKPSGNPIPLDPEIRSYILVGGGIGTAGLILLAEELRNSGKSIKILLGAKRANQLIDTEILRRPGPNVKTITETGRQNTGIVTDLLGEALANDQGKSTIIACGPIVMLQKVAEMAKNSGNKCLVLLEKTMACGVGSCKSCAVFGKNRTVKYVCKDGPAFDASWIDWERLMRRYEIMPLVKSSKTTNPFKTTLIGQGGRTFELKTPIMNASGCLDTMAIKNRQVAVNHAGALITKGVTPKERPGNPVPRVCEVPGGMLNSIGLAGKGLLGFLQKDLSEWLSFKLPVIVNIAGSSVDEYGELTYQLNSTNIAAMEINVSCPNVAHGGMAFGVNPKQTFKIVKAVRENAPDMFLIVKLTPAAGSQIVKVAEAAVKAGADAISLINTIPGLAFDIHSRKAMLGAGGGGLSGPAILPIAIRMIHDVYQANLGVPIIGIGGIHDGASAMQAILAGANAIQVGTALFSNGNAMSDIYYFLLKMIKYHQVEHIQDLIGKGEL